eukprot:5432604-Pyramimonas_sp.AAC.1
MSYKTKGSVDRQTGKRSKWEPDLEALVAKSKVLELLFRHTGGGGVPAWSDLGECFKKIAKDQPM